MKKGILKNLALVLISAALLSSCGPVVHFFNVDERVPATIPVEFEEGNIAVFSTIASLTDTSGYKTERFDYDSLLMVKIAAGIAGGIENNLALDSGTVPVYNHYGDKNRDLLNPDYIKTLSLNSNSQIMFVIEDLKVEPLKVLNFKGALMNVNPSVSYVYIPVSVEVSVYDGINLAILGSHNLRDTIYWEIFSNQDLKDNLIQARLYGSLLNISESIGGQIAQKFFPTWDPQERYIYTFGNSQWNSALRYSDEFKWREAMHIWLEEVETTNRMRAAAASFNIAVSLEMMEKYDLAIDWLNYAEKCFPLEGMDGYKSILTRKLEKQN